MKRPTLVMIPCFAGAPWRLDQLSAQDWPLRTPRLPDDLDDLERLADFVLADVLESKQRGLDGPAHGQRHCGPPAEAHDQIRPLGAEAERRGELGPDSGRRCVSQAEGPALRVVAGWGERRVAHEFMNPLRAVAAVDGKRAAQGTSKVLVFLAR